jgi:hypothetical protein
LFSFFLRNFEFGFIYTKKKPIVIISIAFETWGKSYYFLFFMLGNGFKKKEQKKKMFDTAIKSEDNFRDEWVNTLLSRLIPDNVVETGVNTRISNSETKSQSKPRKNILKVNPKDWVKNNFHFRNKHSRLFVSAILLCLILVPFSTFNSSADSTVTASYLSPTQFEFGGDNLMTWEIDGLSARSTNYILYMNDERVDYGSFSEGTLNYTFNLDGFSMGEYKFALRIKDPSHDIQSYASVSISNYAPVLDCLTETETFEIGSPESLNFEISDKSINNSFYEITINGENSSITDTESWVLGSDFSYSISDLSVGSYNINLAFFDDLGFNSSVTKEFEIIENLAPILSGSEKRAIIEKGDIINVFWGIKDYNNPFGIYTITLDNENISSGVWEREQSLTYEVPTHEMSIGEHRIKLLIIDELGGSSEICTQFSVVTSIPPVITSPKTDYELTDGMIVEFDVTDFEFLSNASYSFANSFMYVQSGLLSDFDYNPVDGDEDGKLSSNTYHLSFEIEQNWILYTDTNYFQLVINDGKGGSSSFEITIFTPIIQSSPTFEIDFNYLLQFLPLLATAFFIVIVSIISKLIDRGKNLKNRKKKKSNSKIIQDNKFIGRARKHPMRMVKIFFVLALNMGIVTALSGAAAGSGGNDPILDLSLSTGYAEETDITGWINGGSEFHIRVYDELQLSWTSDVACNNVIKIKNATTGDLIMSESLYLEPGLHTHSVLLDPNRSLRAWNNFLPGQNYTVQVWLEDFQMLQTVVEGYSDEIEFTIIKAKAQFQFFSPVGYTGSETGIYIVDFVSQPVNPHYQYYYQAQLVDAFNNSRILRNKDISLWFYNISMEDYDFVDLAPSDSNGKFFYDEERYSIQGIPLIRFVSQSDLLYEYSTMTEILSAEFLYSSFDYTGPSTIETVSETGEDPVEPTIVNTLTQIQRIWEWNTIEDYQGFLLNNTSGFYSYGVNPALLSLYLGTVTGNNLTADFISPGTYFFGEDISNATITSVFKTIQDINGYADNQYNGDIFDVDLVLYDEDFNILEEFDLFTGGIVDFTTKTIDLSKTSFSQPTIFRIGYEIKILTDGDWDYPDWDYMDEFYFCLQKVDFNIQFANPQWGSGSMNDWGGYSWESRTKSMDCTFDTSSFTMATRSEDSTSSPFSDIFSVGEAILDSPVDFTHVDVGSSTISLDIDTQIRQIVYQSQDNDGDYSIYVVPILGDGTRLSQIFATSGTFSTTLQNIPLSLDISSLIGQDVEKFAIRVWISVPTVSSGTPDLFNIYFESAEVIVDSSDTFDLVDVSDPSSPPAYYVYRTLEQLPNPITLYSPDNENFFDKVLHVGQFDEGTNWDLYPTIDGSHVNYTLDYEAGDYAIPQDDPISGSDGSKQWAFVDSNKHHIKFNSIYGSDDYMAAYTYNYVYFPRYEESVYLKVGSDEGSRIWFDGVELYYDHIKRTLSTGNSEMEQDIIELTGGVSAGWHRIMTMTEEWTGSWRIRYRISTTGGSGDANFTPIDGMVSAVQKPLYDPRFHPVYLETTPEKTSKTDPNRDSLLFTVPEQRVEDNSFAEIISCSSLTDASGLTNTLFNGSLFIDVLGFVNSWETTSVPLFGDLYFELYIQQGQNLVREYSELVYSTELSDATMFTLEKQSLEINLNNAFVNYSGTEDPDLSDYQVRFVSKFTTNEAGWAPEAGFEIIKSSLVLTDLPPSGNFYGIQDGSILSGTFPLQILANTHDVVSVRFLGSADGVTWDTIGEVGTHSNWIFTYDFDTANSAIFPDWDDEFYIQAQLGDDYKITDISFITVCIDNYPADIEFSEELVDNMVINSLTNISVLTHADDVDHIKFEAKLYDDTWDPANIIFLSDDTYVTEHEYVLEYGFTLDPRILPVGMYNFRAVSYDRTLSEDLVDMDEIANILISWFDPEFHYPSPMNDTSLVSDTFFFNFSSNTENFDNITISTADISTTVLSETTFTKYTTLDYDLSDLYYIGIDTVSAFGLVEDIYYIKFDFTVDSYNETYYYLLFVDNVAPSASISIPDIIYDDFYDPYMDDSYPRIDSATVELEISPYTDCDDLVSLEYFAEIFSKDNSQYTHWPLRQFSSFNENYFSQTFDVSYLPDGEIIFGINITDRVGHSIIAKTQKYFLDKRSPEIFLRYPAISQQILIDPNTENTLNFTIDFEDNDIKNISLYGEILGNEYIIDDLNFTDFVEYPDEAFNFSIDLDQAQSYKFFKEHIENPTLEWKITSYDYFGQETIHSQQFICVEILDTDAPVIKSIEFPSSSFDWTGGFDVKLNISDFGVNSSSGIRYVAAFIDQDPLDLPVQQDLYNPLINSFNGEIDPSLNNFLGYVTDNESDGFFYVNPWEIGEKFAEISEGEHDFLIVVYDNNFNYVYFEFAASIILPELSIDSDTLMATSSIDKNLTIELTEYGDQVESVEFQIYDASTFTTSSTPIDSVTIYDAPDVIYMATFSNVIEKEYYINYIINQTDGSTIERFHHCYLPDGILTALGNPDDYWYDEYNITISDEIPHDLSISINDGDVIGGFYNLLIEWLGDGIVKEININVSGESFGYSIQTFDPNPQGSYNLVFPSSIYYDGLYCLQAEVVFDNDASGVIETDIVIDNSAPVWGDGSGVWINGISQFSLSNTHDGFVEIFTNNELSINVSAYDLLSNITELNCWLENETGNVWSYSDDNLNSPTIDLMIQDLNLLATITEGKYYLYLNITSAGGTIITLPISINLVTDMSTGEFITPASQTTFGSDVITLEFEIADSSDQIVAPIDFVEFYVQHGGDVIPDEQMTNNINYQNSLEFLGVSYERYDIFSHRFVHRLNYNQVDEHLFGENKIFWVKLTDEAGNIRFVQTEDSHKISKYSFSLSDEHNGIYYLPTTDGVEDYIEGTLNRFEYDYYPNPDSVEIIISADHGDVYLPIGTSGSFVGQGGAFEIVWNKALLPPDLLNSRIPVSYSKWSTGASGDNFLIIPENFAMIGNFRDDSQEIAFISRTPDNKLFLFKHEPNTIYNWTREFIFDYADNEAIEGKVLNVDGDDRDEIILRTADRIIVIDYNSSNMFNKTEFLFSALASPYSLDLSEINGFAYNGPQLFISTPDGIHEFLLDTTLPDWVYEYIGKISIPSVDLVKDFTFDSINGEDCLVVVSQYEVLYYSFVSQTWISVFRTKYLLTEKIIVENLDSDPENEILFAVLNSIGSIDVVRADWNSTLSMWRLISTVSYDEISMVYDLGAGHIINDGDNNAKIIVAHDQGIDMVEVNYIESTEDLTVSTSHDDVSDVVEQNGLYNYYPLDPIPTEWVDSNGIIHYDASTEYTNSYYGPTGIDLYQIEDPLISGGNLNDLERGTIETLSFKSMLETENTYYSTGNVFFSMPYILESDAEHNILIEAGVNGFNNIYGCEVYIIDTADELHYQGDLFYGTIFRAYSGTIKEIKFVLSGTNSEQSELLLDTVSVTKQLVIRADEGYSTTEIDYQFLSDEIIPTDTLSPLESMQTSYTTPTDLEISKILNPYTGGYPINDQDFLNTYTESEITLLADLGLDPNVGYFPNIDNEVSRSPLYPTTDFENFDNFQGYLNIDIRNPYYWGTSGTPVGWDEVGTPSYYEVLSSYGGRSYPLSLRNAELEHEIISGFGGTYVFYMYQPDIEYMTSSSNQFTAEDASGNIEVGIRYSNLNMGQGLERLTEIYNANLQSWVEWSIDYTVGWKRIVIFADTQGGNTLYSTGTYNTQFASASSTFATEVHLYAEGYYQKPCLFDDLYIGTDTVMLYDLEYHFYDSSQNHLGFTTQEIDRDFWENGGGVNYDQSIADGFSTLGYSDIEKIEVVGILEHEGFECIVNSFNV